MFQLPVNNLETIRKGRGAVKRILSDIGLEYCQDLLKLDHQDHEVVSWFYKHTKWDHISCGDPPPPKRRKGVPENTRCRLCSHVAANPRSLEYHADSQHYNRLEQCVTFGCVFCPFRAGRPAMERHVASFHPPRGSLELAGRPGVFQQMFFVCRRCSQKSTNFLTMRTHVARAHRVGVASEVIGIVLEMCRMQAPAGGGSRAGVAGQQQLQHASAVVVSAASGRGALRGRRREP